MEIEAPTEAQKAEAERAAIVALAESGATEVEILTKLIAKGIPRADAEQMLPSILEASKGKRQLRKRGRLMVGGLLALGGFGSGIWLYIGGVIWIWPFLIGILGLAWMGGYVRNPFHHD